MTLGLLLVLLGLVIAVTVHQTLGVLLVVLGIVFLVVPGLP